MLLINLIRVSLIAEVEQVIRPIRKGMKVMDATQVRRIIQSHKVTKGVIHHATRRSTAQVQAVTTPVDISAFQSSETNR